MPLGHLRSIRKDVLGFLTEVSRTYGDIAYFRVGPQGVVLLNDPAHIKDVLVTHDRNFVKGLPLHMARRLLGEGLLTSEGDFHARQSRIVQPAFRPQRIRTYGPIMTEYAGRWISRWSDGATVDVFEEMTRMATAIAGKTMFDWDVDSEDAVGIDKALEDCLQLFPWVGVPFVETLLKLPLPKVLKFRRAKAHLDTTIYRLIRERRRDGKDHGDLLSMLLLAQDGDGDEGRMTDEQIRDEALTLFLTSFDTVSLALTWTLYLLSQHETVEKALFAEVDSVLRGRTPVVDDIPNLPLTRMVLSEALRLYPPIYAIARQAVERFSVGEYTVPAGTLILMSPYVIQRDPRYFADPDRFDPERWNPAHAPKPAMFTYFPFGGGPRRCIGQSYAWQEGILVLATIVQQWRLRLAPGHPVGVRPLINLRPSHGMRMVVQHRHH